LVSTVFSFGLSGLQGYIVSVETDISKGIPNFEIVGWGDITVRESCARVEAAIKNQGYSFPLGKIIVNLAPANRKKEGSNLDLALAIGILASVYNISNDKLKNTALIGELSLNGTLRPVKGVLPMVKAGKLNGLKRIILPKENLNEAKLVEGLCVIGVESLSQALQIIINDVSFQNNSNPYYVSALSKDILEEDFIQVSAQKEAKRVLEIAACGQHNLIMLGCAGCGKSMLAKRIPGIMPPLSFEEAFEVTSIYSIAGLINNEAGLFTERPFRSVHSSVTANALIGGGRPVIPGEISLANHGVLFLDEMTEMTRKAVESLRQPLEDHRINISRLGSREILPADFLLIAAANPCKCGKLFETDKKCTCTPYQIKNYLSRLSKPIMDRIDMHLTMRSLKYNEIKKGGEECSAKIRKRVINAREIQKERYRNDDIKVNSHLTRGLIDKYCKLDEKSKNLISSAVDKYGYSVRGYEKIIKIARTIADMEQRSDISVNDVAEAMQYRWFDNTDKWGI